MSFRTRLKTSHPRAEDRVHAELQRRELTKGMFRHKIVWFSKKTITDSAVRRADPPANTIVHDMTMPDFLWSDAGFAVYLDGVAVHKGKALDRDEVQDRKLGEMGIESLRFRYRGKLSKVKLKEICDVVENALRLRSNVEVS